jgi:hypothetical protein
MALGYDTGAAPLSTCPSEEHYGSARAGFMRVQRSAPANNSEDKKMQYQGLFGLIVLIADVWAIVNVFQSTGDTGKKVLWTVLVIILPVLGFILWYFLGPKTGQA